MSTPSPALRQRVEALLREGRVPGASIALTTPSGLAWADGFGLADLASARPARADTVYHLFSGTKLFTAVAVLQLAERGALGLDDAIGAHVPSAAHLRGVTLRHLLSHASGLDDTLRAFLAARFPGEPRVDTARALAAYRLRAKEPPGRRARYRNVNYALLGDVVTRASGTEYADYVAQRVLAPLGMACGFTVDDFATSQMATGYMNRWDPMRLALRLLLPSVSRRVVGARHGPFVALEPYDLASAAIGGLVGTVIELAKFLTMHLVGGAGVLSRASLTAMQALVAPGAAGIESRLGVGLGWKHGRVGDHAFLAHEGAGAGFTSELRLYPDLQLGVVIAMNAMRQPATMRLAHRIAEAVRAEHARG